MASHTITLATNPHRAAVMGWYRKILRSAFTVDWNTDEDAAYVLNETRRLFRRNKDIKDIDAIERKLVEAETRYELALHYRIPYPRMFHHAIGSSIGSGVAYSSYLDSAYDGEHENPTLGKMGPGVSNSTTASSFGGTGQGYLDLDGDADGFDRSRRG